ncbi:MAG: response regulator [Candidatus Hydrogenedens sp.]|nr:response regulator [Candidatus Hydrogenedens sp.]
MQSIHGEKSLNMARILVLDDEENMRRVLEVLLQKDGHVVDQAQDLAAARRILAAEACDLVLADQRLPDGEGLALVPECRAMEPPVPVILLTAYASIDLAVSALREGAFDFLTKPFNPGVLRGAVHRAFEHVSLLRENLRLKNELVRLNATGDLVGRSPAMTRLRELIGRVAPASATVLITGETGTGKELVARAIHQSSARSSKPLLIVNCAAVAEQLLESQLFGHERGAFTGADRAHRGFFEAADEGTLFLDEAGEMSLGLQAKLLRVLMDGEVMRVGASSPRHVDVRVLVATHRDLQRMVAEGRFREDLYYRLNVVPIPVPPLRQRREDVAPLLEHFLVQVALEMKVPRRRVSSAALARLTNYDFPGNVRELRNLVERAYILGRNELLEAEDFSLAAEPASSVAEDPLGPVLSRLPESINLREVLEDLERALLHRALEQSGGVQAEAGRQLGLSRSDMVYRVRKYGLESETR